MARRHDVAYDADQVSCSCGWRTSRAALEPGVTGRLAYAHLAYAHLAFPDVSAEELVAVVCEEGARP